MGDNKDPLRLKSAKSIQPSSVRQKKKKFSSSSSLSRAKNKVVRRDD